MRKRIIAALLLLLLLASCDSAQKTPEDSAQMRWVDIYYENAAGTDALIGSEPCAISTDGGITAMVRAAVEQLCAKPVRGELRSPLPPNTKVQEVRFEQESMVIDFSPEYAALSGVQKTIADACVVMTVSNFWSINGVVICADGKPTTPRLEAKDIIQSAPRVFSGAQTVSIYFENSATGELSAKEESVLLQENVLPERVAMERLLAGEEDPGLVSPLPAGSELLSIDTDANVCYVNFSNRILALDPMRPAADEEYRIVKAIVLTLTSIDYIDRVQIMVDGAEVQGFESLDLRQQFSEKNFSQQ